MAEPASRSPLLLRASLVAVAAFLTVLGVAHTPWVENAVRNWALGQLRAAGFAVQMDGLRYNLLTRRIHIEGLSLATPASPQQPFAVAKAIDVTLPWAAFAGRLSVDSIELDHAQVTLLRRQDGSTNWPSSSSGSSTARAPFPIRRLVARDMAVTWRDETNSTSAAVSGVELDFEPSQQGAAGRLTIARPVQLGWQTYQTTVTGQAELAWDGARLTVASARLQSPEVAVTGGGTVGLLTKEPELALTLAVAGSRLEWRGLTDASFDASLRVDTQGLDVDRAELRAVGGTLQARGRVAFDEKTTSQVAADWRGVDITRVLTALNLDARVPLTTVTSGTATASWTTLRADAMTLSIEATTAAPAAVPKTAERQLGLRGRLSAGASGGEWSATVDQWLDEALHVEGRVGGRVSIAALERSSLTGRVNATADSAPTLWRTLAKLNIAPAGVPEASGGRVQAELTLAGTLADPSADTQLTVTDWRQGPLGAISLTSRAVITTRDVQISDLDARQGRNTLRAQAALAFAQNRLSGKIEGTLPALDELFVDQSGLRASGTVQMAATLSGLLTSPIVDGQVSGERLGFAGQQVDRMTAMVHTAAGTISVDRLELTQPDGRLDASGTYDTNTRLLNATIAARNVALAPITRAGTDAPLDVSARIDSDFTVSGTLDDPRGNGQIDVRDARWETRQLGRISGPVSLADHRIESSLQLLNLYINLTASLAIAPLGAFVVDADLVQGDLAALATRLGVATATPISGTTSMRAHAEGDANQLSQSRVKVDLQQLDARVGEVPVRATQTGTASYDERGVSVDDIVFDVARSALRVGGRLGREPGGTITMSLDAMLADLGQVAKSLATVDQASAWPDLGGRLNLAGHLTGTIDRPAIDANLSVDEGQVALSGVPPATGIALRASYAAGLLAVPQAAASWQGATVTATAEAPLTLFASRLPEWVLRTAPSRAGTGRLSARLDALTPSMLAPWVDQATLGQLGGRSSGTLTLDASALSPSSVSGELLLDRGELLVGGVRFEQQQPTRITLQDGSLRIVSWEWGAESNRVALGGTVQLDGPRALDLSVDGTMDMRALGAFLPSVSTTGRGVLSARVGGTIDVPQFDGRIDLDHGEVRLASPPFIASDLTGRVLLTRDAVTIEDLYGNANGGTLNFVGRFGYLGLRPTDGRVAITGRGIAMVVPDPLQTELDADLSLGVDRGRFSLSGDVTVLGGAYREPLSLASGLLYALQQPDGGVRVESSASTDALSLDLHVTTADDIVVDNNYAQLGLGADVRLRGTLAKPVLAGRAQAREGGRIFLGGQVYQIVGTGAVDFVNPSRIEPDLNITAVTRVAGHEITLSLKGPPARLETSLTSDPPLAQGDIVSLLVTGRVQSDSGAIPTIGRDQLLAYLSGEVLGIAGRAVGLDTLRVEPDSGVRFDAGLIATETDPGSRLTFGKQVTPKVELAYSQNLKEAGRFTWIVAYHPRSNIELRVVSDDENSRLYDFRHDVTIGGAPARRAPASAVRQRVGAIRFTGVSPAVENELRRKLSLSPGKTFDFFRWQQDRDALEKFVRGDDHFEARIIARRSDPASAASGTVDLDYDVRLGRRTIVEIAGMPRPSALRQEIEALWSRAVFDALLIDQATRAARATAVADGYFRATATASIESRGADEAHLVLTVDRGTRFERRSVVFTGNQNISAAHLDALVTARGFDRTAWLDAMPLERAVTDLYRDEGFLGVTVKAGAPSFEERTATLTVAIQEGPPFRIDRIDWVGVKHEPEAVRTVFGLQPGIVLTREASTQAASALNRYYQKLGFNNATVDVAGQPAIAAGTVVLTVTVDEGQKQVLRDVSIAGTRRTSPTLVSRELRLDIGAPVDPAAWGEARKRLYETGVFRQVDVEAVPITTGATAGADTIEQPMRAQVTLDEWPPLRLRYGLQLDDERKPAGESRQLKPGVAGDLTYRNLFGRAASGGLAARATSDFRAARGFVTAPSLFGVPLTSNLFVGRSREQIGPSDRGIVTDLSQFTAEQRLGRRRGLQLAYGYNFQRNHTFNINADPDDPSAFDLTVNVARLTATGLTDTRDDLVDASRGQLFSATFEYAAAGLGSDVRFAKQLVSESYYRRLGRGLVFASGGRLGLAAGLGQDLITSERFFTGGGNTVRGYEENSLGPQDPIFLDAAGGNALFVLNEELRFPIAWRLRGVAFLDAGNVFATIGGMSLRDLRVGAGLGLRVQTPFALLRVDMGAPVARRTEEPRVRFFFSIGQAF